MSSKFREISGYATTWGEANWAVKFGFGEFFAIQHSRLQNGKAGGLFGMIFITHFAFHSPEFLVNHFYLN